MKVVLTGGGTGGHIYPALAFARYLQQQENADILFIGTEHGMEKQIIPPTGFPFEVIPVIGLERRLSLRLGRAVYLAAAGVAAARRHLKSFRPDVVVGTGGYVAGPTVLAARLSGIPTVIHEQNAIPGLTNVWLSRIVARICLSMPGSEKYFPVRGKTVLTGNPRATEAAQVVKGVLPTTPALLPKAPVLLCVGGSHGALKLNEAFTSSVSSVLAKTNAQIIYVTGRRYYDEIEKKLAPLLKQFGRRLHLFPYHEQLPGLLAQTNLMVSRAGATTLAELTALGVPAIIVPSPNVTNNHQEHNARLLSDNGAAIMIREDELSTLTEQLVGLLAETEQLQKMAHASKKLGIPDAAARMAAVLKEVIK